MYALFATIILVLDIIWWLIILAAVFSWLYAFNVINPRNQIVDTIGTMLFKITEPMLAPIRRVMPNLGGIDISPIVLLVIIFFIREFIRTSVMPAVI